MSLKINCNACGKAIKEPGALIFSPPENDMVQKWHMCKPCWEEHQAKSKEPVEDYSAFVRPQYTCLHCESCIPAEALYGWRGWTCLKGRWRWWHNKDNPFDLAECFDTAIECDDYAKAKIPEFISKEEPSKESENKECICEGKHMCSRDVVLNIISGHHEKCPAREGNERYIWLNFMQEIVNDFEKLLKENKEVSIGDLEAYLKAREIIGKGVIIKTWE